MLTVNNKIFQNFDSIIDTNSLIKLKPWVSAYIAKNQQYAMPTKFESWCFTEGDRNKPGVYDAINHYEKDLSLYDNDFKPVVEDLIATDRFGSFIIFEQDLIQTTWSLNVRYNTHGLENKHLASCVAKRPTDKDFQFFYDWLDKQNIFTEYGRVVFFINYPGSYQIPHVDPNHPNKTKPDEFIWINFSPNRKKFYLLDPDTKEKFYADGYVNWFDTENYHAADPVEYACYTLRIDGTFTDEIKSKFS